MSKGKVRRAVSSIVLAHWCKLINDLKASPLDFYRRLESLLYERQVPKLESAAVDWREGGLLSAKRRYVRFLRERITFDICAAPFGTGFFVSWRQGEVPLRLNFLGLFIVLAAVAGAGAWAFEEYRSQFLTNPQPFIWAGIGAVGLVLAAIWLMRSAVSAGLADLDALLLHTPVIAGFYEKFLRPVTYYRYDLAEVYRQAIHGAILQMIDELTESQKLPRLTEDERKPTLRDFYKR
jgi:hypothetical protein